MTDPQFVLIGLSIGMPMGVVVGVVWAEPIRAAWSALKGRGWKNG